MDSKINKNMYGKIYVIEDNNKTSYNFIYFDDYINIVCNDPEEMHKILKKQRWINAISIDNKQMVFSIGDVKYIYSNMNVLQFKSPITIYGNTKVDRSSISTFNQLYISGNLVNNVFPASKIIELESKESIILKFKNNNEIDIVKNYLNTFDVIATIGGPINWEVGKIFDIAKTITSKIKFVFKRAQRIDKIFEYSKIFYNLMVLLCGRRNVDFDINIRVKSKVDGKTFQNDYKVYIDNGYNENYSEVAEFDNVIKIENIWEHIDGLLSLFVENSNQPMLNYIIDNNSATYSEFNVINACNAINNEFDIKVSIDKKFKDFAINYINSISRKEFSEKDRKTHLKSILEDKNKEKIFLKIKIEILYKYYVDYIVRLKKENYLPFCNNVSPNKFMYYLPKFLKIRNSAAHSQVEWCDGKYLFGYIDIIIYFCIFERAGYEIDKIKYELARLFN